MLNISTHYKVSSEGIITVRMEGIMDDLPIFEQCAVLHEVDLFKEWIPFCRSSINIENVGLADLVA